MIAISIICLQENISERGGDSTKKQDHREQRIKAKRSEDPSKKYDQKSKLICQEKQKMNRAKNLLICIGLVFLICWIPINTINLVSDLLYMLGGSSLS